MPSVYRLLYKEPKSSKQLYTKINVYLKETNTLYALNHAGLPSN